MRVRFVPGEYLVVADHYTRTRPPRWLRQEVLWRRTDATLPQAQHKADELRIALQSPYLQIVVMQAYTVIDP